MEINDVDGITIHELSGNCPVQAEGTLDGKQFYFRARGSQWSFSVGSEPVGAPDWEMRELWKQWPEAGWMEPDEARALILRGAQEYRQWVRDEAGLPGELRRSHTLLREAAFLRQRAAQALELSTNVGQNSAPTRLLDADFYLREALSRQQEAASLVG